MASRQSSAAYRIAFLNFGAYAIGLALLGAVVFAVMHQAFTRQLDGMVSERRRRWRINMQATATASWRGDRSA